MEMLQVFFGDGVMFIIVHLIFLLFPIISLFILFIKLYKNKIQDIYKLHQEIKYQCIAVTVCSLSYIPAMCILQVFDFEESERIRWLITLYLSSTLVFLLLLINLKYPIDVLAASSLNVNDGKNRQTHSDQGTSNVCNGYKSSIDAMKDCIANYDGYRLFMEHLIQEFACENLLFLTGMIIYDLTLLFFMFSDIKRM